MDFGGGDLWAIGQDFYARRQLATGQWAITPDTDIGLVFGLAGSGSNLWAVGSNGSIFKWNNGWVQEASGTNKTLNAVYSTAINSTWVVGDQATALERDTGLPDSWHSIGNSAGLNNTDLKDVWTANTPGADVWAVGGHGGLYRQRGIGTPNWAPFNSDAGTSVTFYGVWGTSQADVWAVGTGGTIVHYDGGTNWAAYDSGTRTDLYDVMGSSSGSVWAVGFGGTVLHWDGQYWTQQPSPTPVPLRTLWVADGGVWAAGTQGVVIHLQAP